eukprot:UC4_evm2s865
MDSTKFIPIVVLLVMRNIDFKERGLIPYVLAVYVIAQLTSLALLYYVKPTKKDSDEKKKIKIPAVVQFGTEVEPEKEVSTYEHDVSAWEKERTKIVMGLCVSGIIFYNYQIVLPLCIQSIMVPIQLWNSPLFQVGYFGKDIPRPFPAPDPFGLNAATDSKNSKGARAKAQDDKKIVEISDEEAKVIEETEKSSLEKKTD